MKQSHNQPVAAAARPCSTPHSSPVAWLNATPEPTEEPPESAAPDTDPADDPRLAEIVDQLRTNPRALAHVVATLAPDDTRKDGWTPFARRLFLEVLSETGRISLACDYAGLTKQSAYALRARDSLFAAGWAAACEIARTPLADALYERAVDGVTETITKDGEIVAERHRLDSRLSIAVLNRLDKRCDRAAELGAHHLALVRDWDQWLTLVGKGEDEAARSMLETPLPNSAPDGQVSQLPLAANPTAAAQEPDETDPSDRCWWDDNENCWMTNFAPPADFTGYKKGNWTDPDYERECTASEVALLDAGDEAAEAEEAAAQAQQKASEDRLRDSWFATLKKDLKRTKDRPARSASARAVTGPLEPPARPAAPSRKSSPARQSE